ncbi:membrane-associating domain-containing protein [Pochonia chlamydosporia 170]|uniref:Membrane-associating domain-containing protein n=1 Tax=Pochonia chlamydosporia 170 TaxID=1380566 RepID=A0A179FDP1_METCM|nr:membrane-associating domain-containing protein [Pochonia chlamydosporia 170]OAQ63606.1 membrane-associating domain-containing protein [Pochonia chlamydosporia 170]
MLFMIIFVCTRISQIVTLIPPMGMLAWFINIFVNHNALTPDSILILFILVVLALAWAVFTLFSYHRSSANARFISLVDLCFMGALIAGVYEMRGIADADCTNPDSSSVWYAPNHIPVPNWGWETGKPCSMLKASWAFAIMNIIFFATTALAAFSHGDHYDERVVYERRRTHSSRHSHRHRSRSGGSRHSHRSPHSHRQRVYV